MNNIEAERIAAKNVCGSMRRTTHAGLAPVAERKQPWLDHRLPPPFELVIDSQGSVCKPEDAQPIATSLVNQDG